MAAAGGTTASRLLYECEDVNSDMDDKNVSSGADRASTTWGPWHVKGWPGIAINAFACCYLLVVGFFSFWPPTKDVNAVNMNYSCLILGGIAMLSFVYYFLWARKTYHGPIVEVET